MRAFCFLVPSFFELINKAMYLCITLFYNLWKQL